MPTVAPAVDPVSVAPNVASTTVTVAYADRARGVWPIRARFTMSDGSTTDYNYPAEVWSTNTMRYVRVYKFVGKKPVKIELDPDKRLLDIERTNNVWTAPVSIQP